MAIGLEVLKEFMDTIPLRFGVSGIDCIIFKDHEEIFRYMTGYSDIENKTPILRDSLYNIYSATKMITCTAAMQLVERGKLLLTDQLDLFLPEYKDMKVKAGTFTIVPAKKPIRIMDLFTMSAGLSYELDTPEMRKMRAETGGDFNTRDFVRTLAREPLLFDPGEGWNYSYCHDVLGALIEVVSGISFGQYLKENIFIPLGMEDTAFAIPEEKRGRIAPQYEYDAVANTSFRISSGCIGAAGLRHESGGGGLISSTEDYIKFSDMLACGGIGKNGSRIVSENTINMMRINQLKGRRLKDFSAMVMTDGIGYGLGVAVMTDPTAASRLVPKDSFYWGGIGGVQNFIDPSNRLAYFVAQHTIKSPKRMIEPYMLNILYSNI